MDEVRSLFSFSPWTSLISGYSVRARSGAPRMARRSPSSVERSKAYKGGIQRELTPREGRQHTNGGSEPRPEATLSPWLLCPQWCAAKTRAVLSVEPGTA